MPSFSVTVALLLVKLMASFSSAARSARDGNNVAGSLPWPGCYARRDAVLVERNAMAVRFKRSIHGHIHAGRYTCPLGQDVVFPAAFSQGQRDGVSFHVQERNPDLIEQIALSRRCAEGKRGF